MARRCFYSFHYKPDVSRAAMVRGIGTIEGSRPAPDHDWEQIARGGDDAVKRWISSQLDGRTCTIVLVGSATAGRKWINHEIVESWNRGMGVVGIRIHGLKDFGGQESPPGRNPFDLVTHGPSRRPLSTLVKCYNPDGNTSQERYGWIREWIEAAADEAVQIRKANQ